MKKSVRIRKAGPGETPGYYNKTAKFLKKAQNGGVAYANADDPARLNQIANQVYISLSNDDAPDLVYNSLLRDYGLTQDVALKIMQFAISKLQEEGYYEPDTKKQEKEAPAEEQQNQQPSQEDVAAQEASDAEQEEMAMSDEGYENDEAEEYYNDNSHIEEEQQESAFRFGGYFDDGGESEDTTAEENVVGQYGSPGNLSKDQQQPFSIEDIISATPGIQGGANYPDISYYLGDYQNVSDTYQPMDYLQPGSEPQARYGGALNRYDGGGSAPAPPSVGAGLSLYKRGFDFLNKRMPIQNYSGFTRMLPGFTTLGVGMSKLPLVGQKWFTPKEPTTPALQNRVELWNVLNGSSPKKGVFSQNGTWGAADGTLQADRLLIMDQDVRSIIDQIEYGRHGSSFKLQDVADLMPGLDIDGTIGGIYDKEAKVIGGTDDNGYKFFELKQTFGPSQQTALGVTPSKAKETTLRNRFYYSTDPATGQVSEVFDPFGNPLLTGSQTMQLVKPPALSGAYGMFKRGILNSQGRANTSAFGNDMSSNEYIYNGYLGGNGFDDLSPELQKMQESNWSYLTGTPPVPIGQLGWRGNIGRGLEFYGTSGLNQLWRTKPGNIKDITFPALGYANPALGASTVNPVNVPYPQTAAEFQRYGNYYRRLGMRTALGLGLTGYVGYKTFDYLTPDCQCDSPLEANYRPKDVLGKCPCDYPTGGRTLNYEDAQRNNGVINSRDTLTPDSLRYIKGIGLRPTDKNYYVPDPNNPQIEIVAPDSVEGDIPGQQKKGGSVKNRFIKKLTSMYAEGGEPDNLSLGKGPRNDTLTNDRTKIVDTFKSNLKNSSNRALTEEIYKNAQGNPKIMNLLMQDGPKENLADDMETPQAAYGLQVPSWYRGYGFSKDDGLMSPRQYKKLYKQVRKMLPAGNNISRANMATSMYDKRFMDPGFGYTMDFPEYMSMLSGYTLPLEDSPNSMLYGTPLGEGSNELSENPRELLGQLMGTSLRNNEPDKDWHSNPKRTLALEAARDQWNNEKNLREDGSSTMLNYMPDINDPEFQRILQQKLIEQGLDPNELPKSALKSNEKLPDFFSNKRAPIVGETWDTWYTSDGSTPGFAPDNRTWDGENWIGDKREQGGFVDMDAENPLVRFVYGGNEADYYEPYDLPMADNGIEITNKAGETRMVGDVMPFDEWAEGEKEDFATTHPGVDFDTWKAGDESGDDYQKYADFHHKSLDEYQDFGAPVNNQTPTNQSNTKIQTNTLQTKCGPGTVWNDVYKACIPIATIKYKPRMVRDNPGFFNTVLPWNPLFGYAGSWTKQKTLPYYLADKSMYYGSLPDKPAARYVTKKGILGRPKKWIDIYDVSGTGGGYSPEDMLEIERLVQGKNKNAKNNSNKVKENKLSKTELIDQELQKDEWNKAHWNDVLANKRNRRIARRNFAFDNPEFRRLSDKIIFKAGQPGRMVGSGDNARWEQQGNYYEKTERVREKKKNKKEFGGPIGYPQYNFGGSYNPFQTGTGFGMGVGQGTSAYNQYSQQSQFENDLFGGKPPSAAPPQQQNPFAFITGTGTGSYAETRDTGHTLGNQGQEIIPQEQPTQPKKQFVGVENKRKDMRQFDGEAAVNIFNGGFRGGLGWMNNLQNNPRSRQMQLDMADPTAWAPTQNEIDSLDHVDIGSKTGAYRYDQQGQDRSSRATYGNMAMTRFGGYMRDGGFFNPYFEEDEEVYMTPEELEQFLAAGGQVEYL
jgi:hypothetical protein